jgi:Family of unknown function (DUF6600)
MRRNVLAVLLGSLFLASCVIYVPYDGEEGPPPPRAPSDERTYEREHEDYPSEMDYNDFYEYLSPYGVWVNFPPYNYVWIPRNVGHYWRPYTYGRWAWTDYGWTWVSYHEWGWAPFHYGRWGWDDRLGWFWVPGSIWAPAWVSWRWGSYYVGWCPLPPDIEFVAGVGIGPLPDNFPDYYWTFIEGRYFQYDYLDRYVLPHERNRSIIRLTVHKANLSVRNRQMIDEGIDVDQVSHLTRSEVSRYELEEGQRPGQSRISGESVKIFRPAVKKNELAKPKVFWGKEEAAEKVPEIRADDLEKKLAPAELEQRLKEEQDKELRLLEQSQERDETDLSRRVEDEEKLAGSAAEREKIRKEAEVKSSELKKAHAEEKAKITERHREEEKVVKSKLKEKEKKD